MKLVILSLLVTSLVAPAIAHNFWMCTAELHDAKLYADRSDVSGDKWGVRYELYGGITDIVEWNTNDENLGHHTMYRDRDYGIYDTNDNRKGRCIPDSTRDFDCLFQFTRVSGFSILNCTSDSIHV
ncbi:hypothetical protein JX266_003079 [Neoarthrinium moseri]|nr:hypothetical protein JX266_003079 [Neoarthrinium moseri]